MRTNPRITLLNFIDLQLLAIKSPAVGLVAWHGLMKFVQRQEGSGSVSCPIEMRLMKKGEKDK